MTINNKTITAKEFGFDGCHKIYLINTEKDKSELLELEYNIYPIEKLEETYKNSCPMKFISNADLIGDDVVKQCEEAIFA